MKTHYSRIALGTLISAISLSIASPAFAQFAKPEDAVKYMPWQAFGAGTEGGKAQPNIWTDGAKFKSASEKMQAAVADLNSAAQSGNPENLKKALGATSQTCKACHDDFRKK